MYAGRGGSSAPKRRRVDPHPGDVIVRVRHRSGPRRRALCGAAQSRTTGVVAASSHGATGSATAERGEYDDRERGPWIAARKATAPAETSRRAGSPDARRTSSEAAPRAPARREGEEEEFPEPHSSGRGRPSTGRSAGLERGEDVSLASCCRAGPTQRNRSEPRGITTSRRQSRPEAVGSSSRRPRVSSRPGLGLDDPRHAVEAGASLSGSRIDQRVRRQRRVDGEPRGAERGQRAHVRLGAVAPRCAGSVGGGRGVEVRDAPDTGRPLGSTVSNRTFVRPPVPDEVPG